MFIFEDIAIAASVLTVVAKVISDYVRNRETNNEVLKAENEVFLEMPKELETKLATLAESQAGLEARANEVSKLIEESRSAVSTGRLFNLYSKQIEKYQQQTRSRATWSFIFAIFSMFAGLSFVFWGGQFILSEPGSNHVTAGASISTIGGAVSAYITKTFLDVHKLSLTQLNRYFKQPVINDHILMAQRLADSLEDKDARKKAYETIIESISILIKEKSKEDV